MTTAAVMSIGTARGHDGHGIRESKRRKVESSLIHGEAAEDKLLWTEKAFKSSRCQLIVGQKFEIVNVDHSQGKCLINSIAASVELQCHRSIDRYGHLSSGIIKNNRHGLCRLLRGIIVPGPRGSVDVVQHTCAPHCQAS